MRSLSSSMAVSGFGKRRQRGRPADRRRELAIDLGTGLGAAPGGELVENLLEARRGQVLVIVVVDLRHRGIHAGAQALDLDPGEFSVRRDMKLLADSSLADLLELVGAAQHAGRGAAQLDMEFADRREI